jgi:hypothetical protein
MCIRYNINYYTNCTITPLKYNSTVDKSEVGWGPLDRYGNVGSPLYDTNNYLIVLYKILTTFV